METGCEAVLTWDQPARFRRVCPLLERNPAGYWVCRVAAAEVRPFWGRALGYGVGALLVAVLLAGGGIFGFMRQVGYQVTVRQIFWPPAWGELHGVQAQLFLDQAEAHYAAGRTRDALAALETAVQIEPDNFPAGMLLARIYQAGNALAADRIYARLQRSHPEQRVEIGRAWFRSLLGQGRLEEVAVLAREQLAAEPAAAAVWTNALIFSAQAIHRPALLEAATTDAAVPPGARAVLQLAGRVAQAPTAQARRTLLVQTPLAPGFPYDRIYRAEQLLADGFTMDVLGLLGASTAELGGRDIARLALAAYATAGDAARLNREFGALLERGRG
ncbi:MAG: tetratricopeptide repeat protein [Lacunisphaera sp.]